MFLLCAKLVHTCEYYITTRNSFACSAAAGIVRYSEPMELEDHRVLPIIDELIAPPDLSIDGDIEARRMEILRWPSDLKCTSSTEETVDRIR